MLDFFWVGVFMFACWLGLVLDCFGFAILIRLPYLLLLVFTNLLFTVGLFDYLGFGFGAVTDYG